jgi:hypothetical protein
MPVTSPKDAAWAALGEAAAEEAASPGYRCARSPAGVGLLWRSWLRVVRAATFTSLGARSVTQTLPAVTNPLATKHLNVSRGRLPTFPSTSP